MKNKKITIKDFTPISATQEQVDKIQAILMDLTGEIADIKEKHLNDENFGVDYANKEAGKWFEEVSEAIREI